MISTSCPACGESVSAFAGSCAHCGAANPARRTAIAAATASLFVVLALLAVAMFLLRGPGGSNEPAGAGADFGWLVEAMKACDEDAAKAPDTLTFLVIPMTSAATDDPEWRRKSLNDIGNAILLNSDTALEALRGGNLTLSSEQYAFRVRDEASGTIYKWTPSTGVKRFSSGDSGAVRNFKVQFLTDRRSGEDDWGAVFERHEGNCYWVNAIIGN